MSGDFLVHLICGSTGAGKTTYAINLARCLGAVRFSIDEWMTTLFWADSPAPVQFDWTMDRVNRCEAQIWSIAKAVADHSVPVVLDLGFSRGEHRRKFFDMADAAGLPAQLHFIDAAEGDRWARVQRRNAGKGETFRFEVTREMFDFVEEQLWEPPSGLEMKCYAGIRTNSSL